MHSVLLPICTDFGIAVNICRAQRKYQHFITRITVRYSRFKKVVTPITAVNGTLSSYFVRNPQVLMPPKVLALPRERIERTLCNTGVTAQDVWALLRSDDWYALHSGNKQLVFFYEFVKTEYSRSLASEVFGQAFDIEPSHVRKIRSKAEKKPKPPRSAYLTQ
jgi:hypothetical protein